jgi:DNA-binding transcriptional LysR family regulator
MELRQLECFLELSKFQNVSLTAEKLNISQPALSKTIGLLESELGNKLFDRVGRRIYLNEHGRLFARYAEEALKNLDLARTSVRKLEYHPNGTISIALFSYVGLISDCIHSFLQAYPLAKFEIYSSKSQYTIDNFNVIDFTLSSSLSQGQANQEPFLYHLPIASEEYVVVAAPELLDRYHISIEKYIPLASLHQLPFLSMANNLMFSDITYSFCLQAGFSPNLLVETNDFATKLHMTALGTVVAFIPEVCIPDFYAIRKDFLFLHLSDVNTRRMINLSRKKSSSTSQIAQVFWDFVSDYFSNSSNAP